jgi:hypothetical protein
MYDEPRMPERSPFMPPTVGGKEPLCRSDAGSRDCRFSWTASLSLSWSDRAAIKIRAGLYFDARDLSTQSCEYSDHAAGSLIIDSRPGAQRTIRHVGAG